MAKAGLGRGLGALLPDNYNEEPAARTQIGEGSRQIGEGVHQIPVAKISPSPDQPRKRFNDESLAELAESIKRHGVIQPLIVEDAGGGLFRIVAGERRWRAAALAGLADVPALVRELGRERRLEVALVENVQREDLNPVDEAEAYRQLMEVTNLTQDQVAERVGKSRSTVANVLRLLNLPQEAMESVRSGVISAGHARAILSALNPADRKLLLGRIVTEGISVREAEAAASNYNTGARGTEKRGVSAAAKAVTKPMDPDLARLEQDLIGKLGTKVCIKGESGRGTVVIEYFSMDDLDRVYNIIVGDGK